VAEDETRILTSLGHTPARGGGGIDRLDPGHPNRSSDRLRVAILIIVCVVLFFSFLGARPLWDQDEGMHAATSKEMVISGDWITPTLNGEPFFDKPAFHNWLVAISFVALGLTEFAARLPNAVMGIGCVLVCFVLGRKIFDSLTGYLGALVLATSAAWIILSRTVMHDMSLAFFNALGLTLFYLGYSEDPPRRRWLLLSYAAFGCAALVKGPIGVLLPGAVVFLFLLFRGQLDFIPNMSLGWGVLIGLAVAAPWYIVIGLRNPGYLHYFFVELNFGSFLSEEPSHPQPFYYYIPTLITGLRPWSFFLPVALVRSWRRRTADVGGGTLFLLLWAGVYLLFFSAATSKLPTYILPALPPLALIIGRLWSGELPGGEGGSTRAVLWSYAPFLLIPAVVIYRIATHELPLTELGAEYGIGRVAAASPVAALMAAVAISFTLLARRRPAGAFTGAALAIPLFFVFLGAFIVPAMNTHQSSKHTAKILDGILDPGEPITTYQRLRQSTLFYTDRKAEVISGPADLDEFLASDDTVYCIVKKKRLEESGVDTHIAMEYGDDVVISNRPGDISR
jgi:4-amino-4-deoxy-L-arabinose transferase-like glycosyltransferase